MYDQVCDKILRPVLCGYLFEYLYEESYWGTYWWIFVRAKQVTAFEIDEVAKSGNPVISTTKWNVSWRALRHCCLFTKI